MATKEHYNTVYPWSRWLKVGAKFTIVRGRDFDSTSRTMANYLYAKARKAKLKVSIKEPEEGKLVVVVSANGKGKK